MRVRLALLVIVVSLAAGMPLVAHHSFAAEFDAKKAIRITGALTEIEWTNPHSYFQLSVKDDNATVEGWICEGGSPGARSRRGVKRANTKSGETIMTDDERPRNGSAQVESRAV